MEIKLTKRQKQALESKQRIYESAVELFLLYPYDQVKISDICDKAGVSIGVFYHYFPSKGHIFNEAYINFEKELRSYLTQINAPPLKMIELAIARYLESNVMKGPAYRSVFLKNQLDIKDSESVRSGMKTTLSEYVNEAVECGDLRGNGTEITKTLIRSLRGFIFEWAMQDGSFDLVAEGTRITGIILNHYRSSSNSAGEVSTSQ